MMWDSDAEHFDEGEEEAPATPARTIRAYRRVRKLGEGTYGSVYECRDKATGATYACKVLNLSALTRASGDPRDGLPKMALREVANMQLAGAAAQHVLPCKEVVENARGTPILVMEMLDVDLKHFVQRVGAAVEDGVIKEVARAVATAVAHVHSLGILHRDVKPSNVLLGASGDVMLCDFGSSRAVGTGASSSAAAGNPPLTPASTRTTRQYRAPECLLGKSDYDEALDVWGVGCCVAEMWLGKPLVPPTEADMTTMHDVLALVGWPPTEDEWPATDGLKVLQVFALGPVAATLDAVLRGAPDVGGDAEVRAAFVKALLTRSPYLRPSARDALGHRYVSDAAIGAQHKAALGKKVQEVVQASGGGDDGNDWSAGQGLSLGALVGAPQPLSLSATSLSQQGMPCGIIPYSLS